MRPFRTFEIHKLSRLDCVSVVFRRFMPRTKPPLPIQPVEFQVTKSSTRGGGFTPGPLPQHPNLRPWGGVLKWVFS